MGSLGFIRMGPHMSSEVVSNVSTVVVRKKLFLASIYHIEFPSPLYLSELKFRVSLTIQLHFF